MAVAVKRASEHTIAITNRCPSFVIKVNIICQCDECVFGVYFLAIHLLRQIRQLRAVADLVGIILRAIATSKLFRSRAVPRNNSINFVCVFAFLRVDPVRRLLGVLFVLVFLVLLILIGLVGVVALTLAGVLILISGLGGLFVLAVLGVLVLAVLAVSGSIHVLAVAALGILIGVDISRVRVALDDGRTAAAHHLRGKGRGSHQRQREHHAHQQAHHAPGQIACPFLHVICSSLC